MTKTIAEKFASENTPLLKTDQSCCSGYQRPSNSLLLRFIVRNLIPLSLGIAAGIFVNNLEDQTELADSTSDIITGFITLISAYGTNELLEQCWPKNPYEPGQSIFKKSTANSNDNESAQGAQP